MTIDDLMKLKAEPVIPELIRTFFDEYLISRKTGPEVREVADLFEQVLVDALPFTFSPHECLLSHLKHHSSNPDHDEAWAVDFVSFMIGCSCAMPTENTSRIIACYCEFIVLGYTNDIKNHVRRLSNLGVFDLQSLIKHLNASQIKGGLEMVDVTAHNAIREAIAFDDLAMLEKILDHFKDSTDWLQIQRCMSHFPLDHTSEIQRKFGVTNEEIRVISLNKIAHMREQLTSGIPLGSEYIRNTQGHAPTMLPRNKNRWMKACQATTKPFYTSEAFFDLLGHDPFGAVDTFFTIYPKTQTLGEESLRWVDVITCLFIEAGVSPHFIISHAVCGVGQDEPLATLKNCLIHLGIMNHNNQRFYRTAYQAYFIDFEIKTLVDNCGTDLECQAVYEVTQDRAVLRFAGDRVKDAVLGSDLGL